MLNNDKEYGVTLHYISEGIDSGDIVAIKKIKISQDDTGFTLYKKSENLCYEVLGENIQAILDGNNERITQDELINKGHDCRTYYANDTLAKKVIDINYLKDSLNIIRAFDSPFHEPAYVLIGGEKVYLRTTF